MRALALLAVACFPLISQRSPVREVPAQAVTELGVAYVRENYTKFDFRIPMRDGAKLFTSVYVPKEVAGEGKSYPIMLTRTPYSVRPYGEDQYPAALGPSEFFAREKFIFAYQDVRGRNLSEGAYTPMRPYIPVKNSPKVIDESSDAFDTIDYLIKNVPGNTGKVGIWGISQPGFYATAALLDAHPALAAVSPQAPVTDYYLGDDSYHNGAFMLAHRFSFYQGFKLREEGGPPAVPPTQILPFDYGTPDSYDFYLAMGSLANADEKYFLHKQPLWTLNVTHTTYDEVWQSRAIWKYLKDIRPATMIVGGWFDQEDLQGPLRQFDFLQHHNPPQTGMLVMGPWTHGGFSRGDGDRVGNVTFGSKTGAWYREHIEFPFFLRQLKGRGESTFPKAWVFQTGLNQWRKFDAWPPAQAQPRTAYLDSKGALAFTQPAGMQRFDEYLADPNKPVPYLGPVTTGVRFDYMTEDQRFAATRPDVLVYRTEPLTQDLTIMGPITCDLKVSTSGTDSDFDVKIIDVYPADYPDYDAPATALTPAAARLLPATAIRFGGYQQLVRGEPFRGKFRKSFEKPVPFEPGKPDRITFKLPDVAHTFRAGHRLMIQIQSSWFPITDRNPQKFMDIPNALAADFTKATERVYTGGPDGTSFIFPVLP